MSATGDSTPRLPTSLAALRRFARARPADAERCGLCHAVIPAEHPHLVEPAARQLVCACRACALLLGHESAGAYRRVPDRVAELTDFRLTDAVWEALGVPINLAFFLHGSAAGRVVALFPGPGGVTDSLPPAGAWEGLAAENPVLRELEPDVEALLVHRVGAARDHFRVGVDRCYELVGLIRMHWKGLSGGPAVWGEIARFFASLRERARA